MSTDEKLLKALEDLQAGQKALQADVASIKDGQQQQVKDIAVLKSGQEQQGKLLNGIAATMGTVLEEQQAQRMDIRSLHSDMQSLHAELHASKEELKAEMRAARAEAKRNNIDLQATILKKNQSYERRISNLEEQEGIENPDKN
jgi:hypothetical protein